MGEKGLTEGRKTLQDTIRYVVKDHLTAHPNQSPETVAEYLDCSVSTLYAWMGHEDNATSRPIPVNKLLRLYDLTGDGRIPGYFNDRFGRGQVGTGADNGRTNLSKARIEGEDWSSQDRRGVIAPRAVFVDVNFSSAILTDADFIGATFIRCTFDRAQLVSAKLSGATLLDCTLCESDLTYAKARNLHAVHSCFRDSTHSVLDLKDARFTDCEWFADRYRGGRLLDGADFSGLYGISESHMLVGEIVNRISSGRKLHEMLAGWIWAKYRGCWQAILFSVYEYFEVSEQRELIDAWCENPNWLIATRLEYEKQKRAFYLDLYGCASRTGPR